MKETLPNSKSMKAKRALAHCAKSALEFIEAYKVNLSSGRRSEALVLIENKAG